MSENQEERAAKSGYQNMVSREITEFIPMSKRAIAFDSQFLRAKECSGNTRARNGASGHMCADPDSNVRRHIEKGADYIIDGGTMPTVWGEAQSTSLG